MKSYSIGRDTACDIVLTDSTDVISRRHAVLTVTSAGKMTITDQSTNGTYVNGIKITPNAPVPVTRKDTVSFAHIATLDWDLIPRSKVGLFCIIGAVLLAIIGVLVHLLINRQPVEPPVNTNITKDTTAIEQPIIDTTQNTTEPTGIDSVPALPPVIDTTPSHDTTQNVNADTTQTVKPEMKD